MSNHLISEVYKRRCGSLARTAVMVMLADKASDDGSGIWASKQRMADELGTTRQTIITTMQGLTADGLVCEVGRRKCQFGYTVEYAIDVDVLRALPMVACHDERPAAERRATVSKRHKASHETDGTVTGQSRDRDPTRQAALRDPSSSFTPPVKQLYTNPPRTPLEPFPSDTSYPQGGPPSDPAMSSGSIYDHLSKHFPRLEPAAQLVRWEEAFAAIGRKGSLMPARELSGWQEWLESISLEIMDIPVSQHAQRLLDELTLC